MSIPNSIQKPALVLAGLLAGALAYTAIDGYTELEFASECMNPGADPQLTSTLSADLLGQTASSSELAAIEHEARRLVDLHQAALKNLIADSRWESEDQRVGLAVALAQTREELDLQQQRMLQAQQQQLALAGR